MARYVQITPLRTLEIKYLKALGWEPRVDKFLRAWDDSNTQNRGWSDAFIAEHRLSGINGNARDRRRELRRRIMGLQAVHRLADAWPRILPTAQDLATMELIHQAKQEIGA